MDNELELLDKLASIELFQDFSAISRENGDVLRRILNELVPRKFPAGQTIIREGDEGDTLFILTRGSVRILRNTAANEPFAVVNLTAEQNVFFGELALIDSSPRSATVVALDDCQALELSRASYMKISAKEPLIGFRVTMRIAQRVCASLRKANSDITTLYQALLEEIDN